MKKKKAIKKGYASLPRNRKELFFDVIKQRWRTLFFLGFIFSLSIAPFFIVLILRRFFSASNTTDYQFYVSNYFFLFIASIALVFVGVFLGGLLKNLKHLSYEEPIFLKDDFFLGIKESIFHLLLVVFLFSIVFFLNVSICLYPSIHIAIKGILLGSLIFVFFPFLLVLINEISIYKNSFKDYLHNGVVILVKNYFRILFLSLINLLPLLLFLINNIVILSTALLFYFLLINPFVLLLDMVYFNYIFDISINKKYYPDIFEKGLYRDEEIRK
ncbi:MAG TPA: hypothetical protein DEF61_04705 [Firmicutes bacterium]|nr:hypothetical protein [Bacillota bacterium]HBM70026.1 hypothetical protein [Bacillota bacterium]HBX25529.1 hypothetical protein [Bacillota bacterium]